MQVTVAETTLDIELDRVEGAVEQKLEQYMSGEQVVFDEPVNFSDFTSFQQRVLHAIRVIPYGETVTYAELAEFAHSQKFDQSFECSEIARFHTYPETQESFEYAELAESSGNPDRARAAASACGVNPVPIVVPCHRVVAKDGIGGYRYGRDVKRALLRLERGE